MYNVEVLSILITVVRITKSSYTVRDEVLQHTTFRAGLFIKCEPSKENEATKILYYS